MKACTFPGCGGSFAAKGFCTTHYTQMKEGRKLSPRPSDVPVKRCSVDGCGRRHKANGMCTKHSAQFRYRRMRASRGKSPRGPAQEKSCMFPVCVHKSVSKGLCAAHANQRRLGNPLRVLRTMDLSQKSIESEASWLTFVRQQEEWRQASVRRCAEMILDGYEAFAAEERFGQTTFREAFAMVKATPEKMPRPARFGSRWHKRGLNIPKLINSIRRPQWDVESMD